MSWKKFILGFVSTALVSFPQNMIGCGPDTDPYDYFTSFFHPDLPAASGYKPFYYSSYTFLYDDQEPVEVSDMLAKEWASYCGAPVTPEAAKKFVNKFSRKDIFELYLQLEKNQPKTIPDSVLQNSMSAYFVKSKDLEALGYILYAKQVEPHVTPGADEWEIKNRDSTVMARLIKNGQQLHTAARQDIFKLKFAYQLVRLALYSGRNQDAIKLYNELVETNQVPSVLQPLSLALKAGALFRTNQKQQAAVLFSKVFNTSEVKRISNFLGFKWSVKSTASRNEYLALCTTNEEKAGMLGLFALGSTDDELPAIKQVYALTPAASILEVLVVREINKMEADYYTPGLKKEKGGSTFYYTWQQEDQHNPPPASAQVKAMAAFLHEAGSNSSLKNQGLFETAAAYVSFMLKDYQQAKKYLAAAGKMSLTQKVKDQWALTNILVTINEQEKIDETFEKELLTAVEWVKTRAAKKEPANSYTGITQWKKIYRDLLSEVLARRYHRQGDLHKEALCIGAADAIEPSAAYGYNYTQGVDFMRTQMTGEAVEKLYVLLTSAHQNKFEHFLISQNSITPELVTDFAGTAYLREYDYSKAVEWFKRIKNKKSIEITTDPFIELLYDQEEQLPAEANFKTDKLAFATAMAGLERLANSDKTKAAGHYYKIATGLYNMTYYGHAWRLVAYYRSGSNGYFIHENASQFDKEYFGCYTAQRYFEKAMNASTDKELKARCLFMMARCSQKQVQRPQYKDYNYNWDKVQVAEKAYWQKFKANSHFPLLKNEYSNTKFYKEAYSSCSFLRDFVARN